MEYDPLFSKDPGIGKPHVNSYWAASAGVTPADDGVLKGDIETDVAIIGGGYTGLACAYYLAKEHGIKATVLDANQAGWGCSGRNGGFVRPSIGKLAYKRMIKKWGMDVALGVYAEAQTAMNDLRTLIDSNGLECDVQQGYFKVAHSTEGCDAMKVELKLLQGTFGANAHLMEPAAFQRDHLALAECHGATSFPDYYGLHPMKLVYGLLRLCRDAGARVHTGATVSKVTRDPSGHILQTPHGKVRAKIVVFATNGYTPEHLHPSLSGTMLPVLSHVIVTRPLTGAELDETNFRTHSMIVDTRRINQYYRLLPDNRVLLGSRGAARDTPEAYQAQREFLLRTLKSKLPALKDVTVDYDWNGWVCLTADWVPHVNTARNDPTVHYSLGYGGGGVCFSVRAARLLAANVAGNPMNVNLPMTTTPLARFPMARFRRLGQRAAIAWLDLLDARK